jgi:hypothetical protein
MREYRAECLVRMLDLLAKERESWVCHEDPNGNAALAYTRAQRRQLRQMERLGMISPHILYEASVVHAPAIHAPPLQVPGLPAVAAKTVQAEPEPHFHKLQLFPTSTVEAKIK